ncbi:MAG: translation elongation factor 4 [Candidatus Spechtbacterales bacterium]
MPISTIPHLFASQKGRDKWQAKMSNTRNFVIFAHIDHGKSTLADRFLELTHSVEARKMQEQYLDSMELERERGITIKMQPVTMKYDMGGANYTLNLIDTPGHVDFSYEVSRALAAVEGGILLVDATSGVQAQTVAHLTIAVEQGLTIIPAINKVDLPQARPDEVEAEIIDLLISLGSEPDVIHRISAKTGEGVEALLQEVIRRVPAPSGDPTAHLRALIFDSTYDDYRGVISYIRVMDGTLTVRDRIMFMVSGTASEAKDVGVFSPQFVSTGELPAGSIGYVVGGVKDIEVARIGDTITHNEEPLRASEAIAGYRQPQSVVFSTIFPESEHDYNDFADALAKLKLSDASLHFEPESSDALGRGMKIGFLGMLHMEIILERLRREYNLELVVTAPSVAYHVTLTSGETRTITGPAQFPDPGQIQLTEEPWAHVAILVPPGYMNNAMSLLKNLRGAYKDTEYLGSDRVSIHYEVPLADIISDFYDNLKSVTSGFGSMLYEVVGYRPEDIVKLDILLAGDKVEALSRLVPRANAEREGRRLAEKIRDTIPAEQFAVAIQAMVGGSIVARETRSAMRKHVTGNLYGGDVTRKMKLLEKQKKGKKRLKSMGRVNLEPDVLMKLFR